MDAGTTLAHYEILGKIGVGGMGEVYRARDTKLDRDVALKILPELFTRDPDRHARFHREAQALAAFTHPHVAGIHSIEEDEDQHFLVMELAEGEDLSARVGRRPRRTQTRPWKSPARSPWPWRPPMTRASSTAT